MKFVFLAALAGLLFLPAKTFSQRDYFTPEEIEIIRDAQQMDTRVAVLTHCIDRRFAALNVDVHASGVKEQKGVEWGPSPTGSRLDLLIDIKRILQKAIDDIDNLSERPNSIVVEEARDKKNQGEKSKGFADIFPAAVRSLATAAQRYGPALKIELDKTTVPEEKGAILDSLEMCDEIMASVKKLTVIAPADQKKN
ncbi:MAG TPA: hypothetical protein VGI80_02080 [Pyrinomonadaceae bacterium]|jgi:hypothetical protein